MGCCTIFSRIVLVTINTIFWLASGLMLSFGIAGKANPSAVQTIFDFLIPSDQRTYLQGIGVDLTSIVVSNSIFMIILGVVGLVIATIGFVGACCTVRWLLVTYAILLIILLLAEIALIIFAAVWSNNPSWRYRQTCNYQTLSEQTLPMDQQQSNLFQSKFAKQQFKQLFQQAMRQSITDQYDTDVLVNATGSVTFPTSLASLSWTSVQLQSKCCGAYNYTDFQNAPKWTTAGKNFAAQSVPLSCCLQTNDSSSNAPKFVQPQLCMSGISMYINNKNCYDAVDQQLQDFINQFKAIAIGIAAGIAGLELILIVMAFVLCARGGNDKDGYV